MQLGVTFWVSVHVIYCCSHLYDVMQECSQNRDGVSILYSGGRFDCLTGRLDRSHPSWWYLCEYRINTWVWSSIVSRSSCMLFVWLYFSWFFCGYVTLVTVCSCQAWEICWSCSCLHGCLGSGILKNTADILTCNVVQAIYQVHYHDCVMWKYAALKGVVNAVY
jgi:hypothetical protein